MKDSHGGTCSHTHGCYIIALYMMTWMHHCSHHCVKHIKKIFKNKTDARGNKTIPVCSRGKERSKRETVAERWRKGIRESCGLESNPYPSLSVLITLDVSEKHGTRVWPSLTHFHSPGSVQMIWSSSSRTKTHPPAIIQPQTGIMHDRDMPTLETQLL